MLENTLFRRRVCDVTNLDHSCLGYAVERQSRDEAACLNFVLLTSFIKIILNQQNVVFRVIVERVTNAWFLACALKIADACTACKQNI